LGDGDPDKYKQLWNAFFGEEKTIPFDQEIYGVLYKKGQKRYFGTITRYKNIREFIIAAENFLKNTLNDFAVTFYENINTCNDRYGVLGAEILFDYNSLVIVDIKSFPANQLLNGHTSHCIKDAQHTWDSYVTDKDNKQYYIYNFNLKPTDQQSTIGVTIDLNGDIYAAHAKDDQRIGSGIKDIIYRWESMYKIDVPSLALVLNGVKIKHLWDIFQPMSGPEVEKRKKAKEANREIIKPNLSIELIKKYVKEDGADINKENCIALANAVTEDDLEKAKVILQLGGNPNLSAYASDSVMNKCKSLDMIKLLLIYKANFTCEAYSSICADTDAIKFCLDQGLDPNFNNCYPIRRCCAGSWESPKKIGESYMDSLLLLVNYGAKLIDDPRVIKSAAEYGRIDIMDYLFKNSNDIDIEEALVWLRHSRKIDNKLKIKVAQYLMNKLPPNFKRKRDNKTYTPKEFYNMLGYDEL
jgi:hypothetical protein